MIEKDFKLFKKGRIYNRLSARDAKGLVLLAACLLRPKNRSEAEPVAAR